MSGTASGLGTQVAPSELLARIRKERKRHDVRAKELHRQRVTFGLAAIALSPFAVLFLAIQVSYYREGGFNARLWISAEVVVLVVALLISFWRMGWSHREWIRERLRTELLRREEFLFCARVGPFLKPSTVLLPTRVEERLLLISSDVRDPIELVAMKDKEGDESWRDALEDARAARSLPAVEELPASVEAYLEKRVEDQRKWFSSKSDSHRKWATVLENLAKLLLVGAVGVALFHLLRLPAEVTSGQSSGPSDALLVVFAIFLPAFGAMLVGIQSLLESDRLSRSYAYHAKVLEDFEALLRRLKSELAQANASRREALQFEFMRIVLKVEGLLANELRQWWLVMHPRTPRAGH